jgi:multimeric flavodoxin WrbA
VLEEECRLETEVLDLARLASEYGRKIHPCKACFSTAAPLCHWPCSCYPNHSPGQTQDWMNEIYPMWMAAHGIMIITPVNWYHTSSSLKLMIDRLVCADGGNADPTLSRGKDAARAKEIELEVDRYIGYFEPYATSHDALDADLAIQEEVRNAARTLAEAVLAQAAGRLATAGQDLPEPRSK